MNSKSGRIWIQCKQNLNSATVQKIKKKKKKDKNKTRGKMSFLAGRLAGKEGAYFFQESKQAVNRLVEKTPTKTNANVQLQTLTSPAAEHETPADVLPEVLRHSLPSKIFGRPSDPSSLSRPSKWALHSDRNKWSSVSPDALNPLRAYVSLPQVTFGPKRFDVGWCDVMLKFGSLFSALLLVWCKFFSVDGGFGESVGGNCPIKSTQLWLQRLMN